MAHIHDITDSDKRFIIDVKTRAISFLGEHKLKLNQGDHNSERATFAVPRFVEGHDMLGCSKVEVHFNNISADKKNESRDVYPVADVQVSPDSDDVVIFSWLISGNATRYAGILSFLISFECLTGETIDYAWHTGIYSDITVGEGMDNGEAVIAEYSDVLEKWKQEILASLIEVLEPLEDRVGSIDDRVTALEGALIDFKETESEAYEVTVPEKASSAFVQSYEMGGGAVTAIESRSHNILDMEAFATGKRTHAASGFTLEYDATEKCLILNGTNGATPYDCFMTYFNNKPEASGADFNSPVTLPLDTSKKYNTAIEVISGTSTGTIAVKMRPSAKSVNINDGAKSIIYTVTEEYLNYLNIYLGANCTADNLKFRIALIEQDAGATEAMPYVKYFKHSYIIPEGIQSQQYYDGTCIYHGSECSPWRKVDFVNKEYSANVSHPDGDEAYDTDISAHLDNGISGLLIPVVQGGIIRFVNADSSPVTSNITFVIPKV